MFFIIFPQIKVQLTEDVGGFQPTQGVSPVNNEPSLCIYFVNGYCNRGSQCCFSHSLEAKRPACKFFFSLQVS